MNAATPSYQGDDVDDTSMLTGAIAASNLPQTITAYAQSAETQEGEGVAAAIVGDMSGSLLARKQDIINGLNDMRGVLMTSHERRKMHLRTLFFNRQVMPWEPYGPKVPFLTLLKGDPNVLPEFDGSVYHPSGSTSLYQGTLEGLAAVDLLAKGMEDQGFDVRRVLAVFSDGLDNEGTKDLLAQLREAVIRRRASEKWTFLFYGFLDPAIGDEIARELGEALTDDEIRKAFNVRLFRAIACGGDKKMEKALKNLEPRSVLGGMGFPENMVDAFSNNPDEIRQGLGVKLSSTFVKASAGKINVNVPIQNQVDPNANAGGGSTFV